MKSADKKIEQVVPIRVSFLQLFKYATFYDWILISFGVLFAIADGGKTVLMN
jgi:hypothetical protein